MKSSINENRLIISLRLNRNRAINRLIIANFLFGSTQKLREKKSEIREGTNNNITRLTDGQKVRPT